LSKEHSTDPARLGQSSRIAFDIAKTADHQFKELSESLSCQLLEFCLPADGGESRALTYPVFDRLLGALQYRKQRKRESFDVGPGNDLAGLQWRWDRVARDLDAFALFEAFAIIPEVVAMGGHRAAKIVCDRWARKTDSDSPMVAGRRERKRVDLACQRFSWTAEFGVDAASTIFIQKNAAVVGGASVEPPLSPPPRTDWDK
jgi:hypothetical protein